jgi:hypothetical protein
VADDGRIGLTGLRAPLIGAAVSGVAAFVVTELFYATLPPLPWTAIPTVLLVAGVEFIAADQVRRRVRRLNGAPPMDPLLAARLLALAKASIGAAAVLGGAFAGFALAMLDVLHAPGPRADLAVACGSVGAAALLAVAGAALERACRSPGSKGD